MSLKIEKKIVGYNLVNNDAPKTEAPKAAEPATDVMNEMLSRPEKLRGTTYKVKPPVLDTALYITINDIVINEGTPQEQVNPFEIFINSKNMEHFQWIVALTRVMSAVFRKGGDITFLVDELSSVFDPSGGYFKKGGVYMPSLVAEIGEVVKQHLISIGKLQPEGLDEHQKKLIAAKMESAGAQNTQAANDENDTGYPAHATVCKKCKVKAVTVDGGCATCLNCADSKCG